MEKKNKHKKLSPQKCFKRFLKDKGLFPFYQRTVKPNKGIREFFRATKPMDYLNDPPISKTLVGEEIQNAKNILKSHMSEWETYFKINPLIEEIKDKFIVFLKKRSSYELYINCFNPLYVKQRIEWRNRMAAWRRDLEQITIKETTTINSWEELNPKFYLTEAFNVEATIKSKYFWEDLNKKWQQELNKIWKQ